MSKQTTDIVLNYYERSIKVSSYNINEGQITKYNSEINDFVKEQRALMDHLRNFKQHIKQIVPMKEQELMYYKQFASFLQKYEEGHEKPGEQN